MSEALRPVVSQWVALLEEARKFKQAEFQDDADDCMRFLDGPYDWLYKPRTANSGWLEFGDGLPGPTVRITVNKVAELVQLFGPALYHRNPVRKVNPRKPVLPYQELYGNPSDPNAQMAYQQAMMAAQQGGAVDAVRGDLIERYLNYTPAALDLKTHSRWAITEALIKGMGLLWSMPHKPPGATQTWVGSFFDSVDNLQMDPDATNVQDVKWIARRRVRPTWEVEREFQLPAGSLRSAAGLETAAARANVVVDPGGDYRRRQGRSADLTVYFEVFSKMGMGGRLTGVPEQMRGQFDQLGDFVYLAVCDSIPYPLNLPPPLCDAFASDDPAALQAALPEVQQRTGWQTPYWADNGWPVTFFVFHWRPGKLWPMSHMKPGMGELRFLNWAWSFLAQKVRTASRDFIAIAKAAGEDLKEKIKHGVDFTVVEVDSMLGSIDQVVKFLQHPGFNPEIYRVIEGVAANFERRVGLTELMYGQSGVQMRSAQEAQVKADAVNVRPDDMANTVEDCMTEVARKEAFAARWHLLGQDVVRVLGPDAASLWERLVVPSDPASVLYSLEYRIEANSARKPNKAMEAANMQTAVQNLFQPLFQYAQATGQVGPVNKLISDWARSIDLTADEYLLSPPPPPAPAGPGGPAGGPPQGVPA